MLDVVGNIKMKIISSGKEHPSNWRSCERCSKDVVERLFDGRMESGECQEFGILVGVLPVPFDPLGNSLLHSRFHFIERDWTRYF
jgi:hypothetical protein